MNSVKAGHRLPVMMLLLVVTTLSFGWGNEGHQTVGAMADKLIVGTSADEHVKQILKNKETLTSVAIWADCAKGYCGPLTQEMKDFVAHNPTHHNYHYTDVPFQKTKYHLHEVGTADDDVVQILNQCIWVLQGRTDATHNPHQFTERQALLLMTHFVGDIHQPLHVGTAYVDDKDDYVIPASQTDIDNSVVHATHGDNYLMLGSKNLHSYWDTNLVKMAMRRAKATTPDDYADYLLSKYPTSSGDHGDVHTWPEQWANASLKLAGKAHADTSLGEAEEAQDRNGSPHLSWPLTAPSNYGKNETNDAQKAIADAGHHLADLLKAIWP